MEHFTGLVQRRQRRQIIRRQQRPVGDVQPAHHNLQPAVEHFRGGFRVDSDIEFRIRREVAAARRAAHDHQPANIKHAFRVLGQQQRYIGQRANRHQGDRLGSMHKRITDSLEGRLRQRLTLMLNKVIPLHAGFAMHRGGVAQRTHQRHRRPLRQRYIGIPEMQQLQRVTGRLLHRDIARYGGHQLQIQLRREQRRGNGGGIVDARIGIKNDW